MIRLEETDHEEVINATLTILSISTTFRLREEGMIAETVLRRCSSARLQLSFDDQGR